MEESDPQEASSLQPGALVAERWQLVERLGSGGFGSVWRATHTTLAHDVAIKFLHVGEVTALARARFEREARIAARLGEASRHITRVIDYGVFRGTVPYLCMELLHGETLSQRLRREGRLPLRTTARMIVQLCRALQVAHTAGVIHRDLKPSNIFLSKTDLEDEVLVKLMDFGIAKSTVEQDGDETTRQGTVVGTPAYMCPEQILSKKLDPRADLWGVAACVYRMVCGRSPFGQGGFAELGLRILATDPLPPSALVPELPKAFDAWMAKALAKGAEDRFQSARDLGDALATAAAIDAQDSAPTGVQTPLPDRLPHLGLGVEPASSGDLPVALARASDTLEPRTHGEPAPMRRIATRKRNAQIAVLATLSVLSLLGAALLGSRLRESPRATAADPIVIAPAPMPVAPRAAASPVVSVEPAKSAPSAMPSAAPPPAKVVAAPSAAKPKSSASTLANEAAHLWTKKDEL
jgi:serine/threonine-protein kinase